MSDDRVWRIEIGVPAQAVAAFEAALQPHCESVSWFVTDEPARWHMEGFCRSEPDRASLDVALALAAAAQGLQPPEVEVSRVPPRDWLADSLRNLPPIRIGRYYIYGSHHAGGVPTGAVGLLVDAGRAFGSGQHQTTAGCLAALDGLARRRFGAPLDMGCGSGVLALAMARTWRVPVVAVDADRKAVAVTAANARRNRVRPLIRAVLGDGYGAAPRRAYDLPGSYDLIVSNILANPLCRMAGGLSRCLERGGVAVLSGFLESDGNRVLTAHRRWGLSLMRRITIDGWQTLVLKR